MSNPIIDLASARIALQDGRRDQARELLARIVRANPQHGEAWHLLGRAVDDAAQKADCSRRAVALGYVPPAEVTVSAPPSKSPLLDRLKSTSASPIRVPQPTSPVEPLSERVCLQCGEFNPDASRFCAGCGAIFIPLQAKIEQQIRELLKVREAYKQDIIELEDIVLLQSFGFYTPRYALQSTEAYKLRLDEIRSAQERAIRNGDAVKSTVDFTVNNNRAEGIKMIKDYTKLLLRSFNNECDASIVGVKFSNIESIEKRIRLAFFKLNQLGSRMHIHIQNFYLDLKIQELYLVHEYQVKKQEEKEEQKLLRAQLREEAKAQKEIEEMRQKLEKEQRHFIKAMREVEVQLQRVEDEAERERLEMEKVTINTKLGEIEHINEDIRNREQNTRAGYVYVISNIGAFGENVYKIGMTRRLEPQDRIDELGDASVPFRFDVHAMIFSEDAPGLENALHRKFEMRRLNRINRRREFFHVTLDEIAEVIREHFKKPVELIDLADAAEYRQSLILRNELALE